MSRPAIGRSLDIRATLKGSLTGKKIPTPHGPPSVQGTRKLRSRRRGSGVVEVRYFWNPIHSLSIETTTVGDRVQQGAWSSSRLRGSLRVRCCSSGLVIQAWYFATWPSAVGKIKQTSLGGYPWGWTQPHGKLVTWPPTSQHIEAGVHIPAKR